MGLDLTLIPIEYDGGKWGYGHTLLDCCRSSDLFGDIIAARLSEMPVPAHFSTFRSRDDKYEDSHYGDTQETPYGEPLMCVATRELLRFAEHESVTDNRQNRAVWRYLGELDPDTKIALYWH